MPLETATYISDLNTTYPQSSDTVSQADDHLRLIKATLKTTFPNVTGVVSKSHSQINDLLEKAGGTMTGALVLSGPPAADLQAATKAYVDASVVTKVDPSRAINTGTGLSGGGDLSANRTISIANGGVSTTQLADGAVSEAKIATGAVATAKIADGAVTPAKLSQKLTQATAQTSGSSIDFTGIPSWAKKITVMFSGVSWNGSGIPQVRLGTSGGVETTGYAGASNDGGTPGQYSSGFNVSPGGNSAHVYHGQMIISNITGNTWVETHTLGRTDGNGLFWGGGSKALTGTLDRIRVTTSTGSDTLDAGSINILYE